MSAVFTITGLDHLEFYVGNAKQAAAFYSRCFGFRRIAYRGLETGDRSKTSYVLEQGEIRFAISAALCPEHPIANSVLLHGDTIAVIAFDVSDVNAAYQHAVSVGAVGAIPPSTEVDEWGVFRFATIHTFGDTQIKFIDRRGYVGNFAPGYVECVAASPNPIGLTRVDHVVGNVECGAMERWVQFFVKAMGFDVRMYFDETAISTEYSALMSMVLENSSQTIVMNINEPAKSKRKSQIQEYLDFHYGPGIQHVGLATDDIRQTVMYLRDAGIEFLPIPKTYYESLGDWVKDIDISVEELSNLGILVDRDDRGYLLQLFTKPTGDRPTLFFEIIERHGSRGFGAGNFKSLFVALESEQELRGNL